MSGYNRKAMGDCADIRKSGRIACGFPDNHLQQTYCQSDLSGQVIREREASLQTKKTARRSGPLVNLFLFFCSYVGKNL